jgi:hypothetical protein
MRYLNIARDVLVLNAFGFVMFSNSAFAYVDPGSGSVIVTTILGVIGAIGYTFRKQFYRLRRAFGRKTDGNAE